MYKLKNVPLTISGILKDAWELYKPSFKFTLPWSIMIAIIHVIPFLYGFVGFYQVNTKGSLSFSWWALLIYVILLIAESFFLAVMFYIMHLIATEQKINYKIVFEVAKSQIFNLYFAMLIYFLAVSFGIFLLVLPGVFAAILFAMFLPFIIVDRQTVIQSFASSARLVWGYWWQSFFVLAVPYIISYLIRNFIRFTPWAGYDWLTMGDAIILAVFVPYFYGILMVQFHNLKIIKSLPAPVGRSERMQS